MHTHRTIYFIFLFCILEIFVVQTDIAGSTKHSKDTAPSGLRLSTFDIDATPPVGSHLAYDSMIGSWDMGLRARGIVLSGAGQPVVLCAIDWIGISGESQDVFKRALADAAGTIPERVAVHTLHQHDAPRCNFAAERILLEAGLDPRDNEGTFARELISKLETAVRNSLGKSRPVTHLGLGEAPVYQVASNRRILGPDGKVKATRWTTCTDSALRAEPEGVIDPMVSLVSFWNGDQPLAVLSYYAVHPQSYYHTGIPNPDFPGIARFYRQLAVPQALHVHFNGAGGNLGAGKYNDGSKENRGILAERLADGMKRAWEGTQREPITADAVNWTLEPVSLPPAKYLEKLEAELKVQDTALLRINIEQISWIQRCKAGKKIDVACLTLNRARILYLPGELFVEYQLAAKAERKDLFVAMAAYGDYGPGYIGTAIAYEQGGYEAGIASRVSPEVEGVLMTAIRRLLNGK
ncbi:MAG: hypothetical protein NTZ69_17025 [Bacteroidia bacterium]|nr:hypothetical protein [Bacteroidia bacterium]